MACRDCKKNNPTENRCRGFCPPLQLDTSLPNSNYFEFREFYKEYQCNCDSVAYGLCEEHLATYGLNNVEKGTPLSGLADGYPLLLREYFRWIMLPNAKNDVKTPDFISEIHIAHKVWSPLCYIGMNSSMLSASIFALELFNPRYESNYIYLVQFMLRNMAFMGQDRYKWYLFIHQCYEALFTYWSLPVRKPLSEHWKDEWNVYYEGVLDGLDVDSSMRTMVDEFYTELTVVFQSLYSAIDGIEEEKTLVAPAAVETGGVYASPIPRAPSNMGGGGAQAGHYVLDAPPPQPMEDVDGTILKMRAYRTFNPQ